MKKTACTTAVLLAALLSVQADDNGVKGPQEKPEATKTQPFTEQRDPLMPPKPVIPANLRNDPSDAIPFPQPASGFQENPQPTSVKVGSLPDVLQPMGSPAVTKMTVSVPAKNDAATVELPPRPVVEIPQATEKTPAANTSTESITVSPFLDWIQNTKNAAEIARQQRQAIEQDDLKDKSPKDGTDQDLFLHIRFPYVGNQDLPPSGGSVTYSIPQR